MLEQLARRLREAEDQIEIIMLRDPQAKIVVAITKLAQQAQAAHAPNGPLELLLSPMELSTYVGLDVDTVKRKVRELRHSGYIQIEQERVIVPDLGALVELFGLLSVKDRIVGVDHRTQ